MDWKCYRFVHQSGESCDGPNMTFLSPPVHFARWAHMRRFLSVRHKLTWTEMADSMTFTANAGGKNCHIWSITENTVETLVHMITRNNAWRRESYSVHGCWGCCELLYLSHAMYMESRCWKNDDSSAQNDCDIITSAASLPSSKGGNDNQAGYYQFHTNQGYLHPLSTRTIKSDIF